MQDLVVEYYCCFFDWSTWCRYLLGFFQDVEIKEEGTRHMLILFNVRMDMAGGVDFSAANAKSNAQLRVKGDSTLLLFICSGFVLILQSDLCSLPEDKLVLSLHALNIHLFSISITIVIDNFESKVKIVLFD